MALASYYRQLPFARSGWRLKQPGGPDGGQHKGFVANATRGTWPAVENEYEADREMGASAFDPGYCSSSHPRGVYRSSAEPPPRPNASGNQNVYTGFQTFARAGRAVAPGSFPAPWRDTTDGRMHLLSGDPGGPIDAFYWRETPPQPSLLTPGGSYMFQPANPAPVSVADIAQVSAPVIAPGPGVAVVNAAPPQETLPDGSVWQYGNSGWVQISGPTQGFVASPPPTQVGPTSVVAQPAPVDYPQPAPIVQSLSVPPISPSPAPTVFVNPATMMLPANQTAAVATTSPVPAGYNINATYTDGAGNIWAYNPNTGAWQAISGPGASLVSPVPAGYPTTSTYTDSSGNVWAYNNSVGSWQIAQAATTSRVANFTSWLESSSIISAVPNWALLAGAGLGMYMLTRGHKGGRR